MSTSRRKFLKSGAMATLLGVLCFDAQGLVLGQKSKRREQKKGLFKIPEQAKRNDLYYYTKATFEPYVNSEFLVRTGIRITKLTLIEIDDCAPSPSKSTGRTDNGECFILIFSADRPLTKGVTISKVNHAALGRFELFLSNMKKWSDPNGLYYQAVINHTQPSVL